MSEISDRNSKIYIVGPDSSLNGALSYVFEKEIGSQCVILNNGDSFSMGESTLGNEKIIFLIDCIERDFEKELIAIRSKDFPWNEAMAVALFNLQKGTLVERRAFKKGIKGFFYRDDSLLQILKGLRSLIKGETWVSREILVEVALQSRIKSGRMVQGKTDLTRRETEILALLSIGSSNDEIADKLFISPNTVKTHLYRIFRKIKVPNRFQAALWAAKNL